ncbi:MAG TPA: L-2-amino-thiazoline-4-carboxylic acid hydrolase [Bacteroidia bacterium]|nr:L-2-amino-thiazoline-4-carboxylic acid hydrolase [Bacteroidia bacterium]
MIRQIVLFWFKVYSLRISRIQLAKHFPKKVLNDTLDSYWKKYLKLKQEVPDMPTTGGSIMVHLAAMSTAFYNELIERDKTPQEATKLFYDIAWEVYKKMGRFTWRLTDIGKSGNYNRLKKATNIFRAFPFNSPSYLWEDRKTTVNEVSFDCLRCPVAEYFQKKGLSQFCVDTWCNLDYPLAEMWNSKLIRKTTIAGGSSKCDFRWIASNQNGN